MGQEFNDFRMGFSSSAFTTTVTRLAGKAVRPAIHSLFIAGIGLVIEQDQIILATDPGRGPIVANPRLALFIG